MAFEMRLDRIELTNFHQFEHYAVDFDEHLTVLVGNNGSGKTSLLDAACVAAGTFLYHLAHGEQRAISRFDARIRNFDVEGVTDRQEQYPVVVKAWGHAGDDPDCRSITWSRSLASSDGKTSSFEGARELINLSSNCQKRMQDGDESLVLPLVACYGTQRLWTRSPFGTADRRSASFSRSDGYRGALSARIDKDQMLTWFFKMAVQDLQRAQSLKPMPESPLYAAVRDAIERCFRALTGCERVRISYNLDVDDLDVEYVDTTGEVVRMDMSMLSDGYRTTLGMVADIAYRMAVLNPALGQSVLSTPGIVVVDEIDLHLHPLWQARILRDLRDIFPNVQFIVTTHAPVVVSSVRAQHIRILNGGDEAITPSGEVYGSDVGRVLFSVMGATERLPEVQGEFDEFYQALGAGDFSLAHELLERLEGLIGSDDTELVGAQTALSLEEADARYAAD